MLTQGRSTKRYELCNKGVHIGDKQCNGMQCECSVAQLTCNGNATQCCAMQGAYRQSSPHGFDGALDHFVGALQGLLIGAAGQSGAPGLRA